MKKFSVLFIFLLFMISTPVFSQDRNFNITGTGETFKLDILSDSVLLGTGAGLNGTWLVLDKLVKFNRKTYVPVTSDGLLDKSDINPFDRLFVNPYNSTIHNISTIGTGIAVVSPLILAAAPAEEWLTIGVMYAETMLIANGLKEITKLCINRPRPYMYNSGYPEEKVQEGDWNKSFPSGHTTLAFAGAAFCSCVFKAYFPDSPWRFAVYGGTFSLAVSVGILRIVSGNHFMTDVIAGAVLGTTCGICIPLIHTKNLNKKTDSLNMAVSPLGFGFSINL